MGKWTLAALFVAASIGISSGASATVYLVNFTSAGHTGVATFTTAGDASISLTLVTGLTGTLDSNPMTLLAPGSFAFNDNLFAANFPHFDNGGLSFSAGSTDYNLFTNNGIVDVLCIQNSSIGCSGDAAQISVTVEDGAVPEPATWALMLVGFGAMGLMMRCQAPALNASLTRFQAITKPVR